MALSRDEELSFCPSATFDELQLPVGPYKGSFPLCAKLDRSGDAPMR